MQASWHLQNVQRWLLDLKRMWRTTVPHILKICHFCGKYGLFIIDWTLQVLCCQQGLCMVRCWRCQLQFLYICRQWAWHTWCLQHRWVVFWFLGWWQLWRNMNVTLNQWWVLPKPMLLKLFFLRHADLAGTNRKFWTWNWLLFCQKHKVLEYTAVNF